MLTLCVHTRIHTCANSHILLDEFFLILITCSKGMVPLLFYQMSVVFLVHAHMYTHKCTTQSSLIIDKIQHIPDRWCSHIIFFNFLIV